MQMNSRLLDDFARMASGAMGAAAGFKGEFESLVRRQLERILDRMELVGREEFDVVKRMAAKARTEQEALDRRVAALEGARRPARKSAGAAKKAAATPKAAGRAKPAAAGANKAPRARKKPAPAAKKSESGAGRAAR